MKHVALVTCRDYPKLTQSDQLLVEPLKKEGFTSIAAPWEDKRIDWKQFDCIIFRSCWNYYANYPAFIDWLSLMERMNLVILNPPNVIAWNSHKTYLKELHERGVSTIPTLWISQSEKPILADLAGEMHWTDIIIKPCVGADAHDIFLVKKDGHKAAQKKLEKLTTKTDCLMQPLMPEVMTEGEYSFVFISGKYSHTVLKTPKKGEFRSNYQFGAKETVIQPSASLLEQVTNIVKVAPPHLLYARVDGINQNGLFILMELELFEPHLYFDKQPDSAQMFARALKKFA